MGFKVPQYKEVNLTQREFLFANAILRGLDNLDAIKEAGFKGKNENAALVAANRLLTNDKVQSYISKELEKRQEARRKSIEMDDLDITKSFRAIYNRCMQAKPVLTFDRDNKQVVQAVDEETGELLYTFDSNGAVRAMENIAKHYGYFEADNRQKSPTIQVNIQQNNNYFIEEGEEDSEREIGPNNDGQYTDRSISEMLPPSTTE